MNIRSSSRKSCSVGNWNRLGGELEQVSVCAEDVSALSARGAVGEADRGIVGTNPSARFHPGRERASASAGSVGRKCPAPSGHTSAPESGLAPSAHPSACVGSDVGGAPGPEDAAEAAALAGCAGVPFSSLDLERSRIHSPRHGAMMREIDGRVHPGHAKAPRHDAKRYVLTIAMDRSLNVEATCPVFSWPVS